MILYIIKSLYGYWKRYSRPHQRIITSLAYLLGLAVICICFFTIYYIYIRTGVYRYLSFQIAALIEIGLAYVGVIKVPANSVHGRGGIWAFSLTTPVLLGATIEILKPIMGVGYIFLYSLAIFLTFQWYHSEKAKKRGKRVAHTVSRSPFTLILPSYLPEHYQEVSQNTMKNKKKVLAENIYERDDSENILWFKQSEGPIPDSYPPKNAQISDEIIKGISVSIAQENKTKRSNGTVIEEPEFIQADWEYRGLYFNLRADELDRTSFIQIIHSMIK